MSSSLLVINAGSSSLKFSVFVDDDPPALMVRGLVEGLNTKAHFIAKERTGAVIAERRWGEGELDHEGAIAHLFSWGRQGVLEKHQVAAVGHRVVHGGSKFAGPVLVNDQVMQALDALVPLAPLHQPHNLAAIRAVSKRVPSVTQVACFDTAFHRTQPMVAQSFGFPRR